MAGEGPASRLFTSLANALLDLGLPRMRAWLRERVGPNADVARVSTEGPLIHLDGVKLPIGARGELFLERATAVITSARARGVALPEVRLHAFRGVLSFTGADQFRADVELVASPDAPEDAWVAGELTIRRATWSVHNARNVGPAPAPLDGRARLVVTSTSWSLEDGALRSEHADVRFAGRGAAEGADPAADRLREGAADAGIETASLVLAGARVGPFVDAVQALLGQPLEVPAGVPLDARLEGDLAWDATGGGRCTLHITAEGLDARLVAQVGADGKGLAARASGTFAPAVPLRRAGVPEALVPRGEDVVTFGIEATGDAAHPEVHAKLVGAELGFRFGRPRFQPALLARALEVVLDVPAAVGGAQVARLRGSVRLSAGTLAIEGDVPLARDAARSVVVRATDLEPMWVAAVAGALSGTPVLRVEDGASLPAGSFAIPRDARFAAEVVVDVRGGSAVTTTGHVTMTTPRGALAAQPLVFQGGAFDGTSLRGRVAFADTLRMNLFPSDVRPLPHGWLDVDLALSGAASALVLKGTLAAPEVRLSIASRPDVAPFAFESATAALMVDTTSVTLSDLRFRGYGGTFAGHSTIVFAPSDAPAPALVLACRNLDSSFVEALASLARGALGIRVEREGPRPPDELWIPRVARVSGEATLGADLSLSSTLALEIRAAGPATEGSALEVGFVLGTDRRVDGSKIRGTLAVAHALTAGAFDTPLRPLAEGAVRIEATLKGPIDDCVLSGFVSSAHLRMGLHEGRQRIAGSPVFVVSDLSALFRLDASKMVWHRLSARACGGTLSSSGVVGHGAATASLQATVAARDFALGELPVDDAGRTLAEMARGRLAVDLRFDRQAAGPVTGRGDLRLDAGAFPILARSKAALGRYGLVPPAENAIAPATCVIFLHERGWSFCDARAAVPGCEATGRVDVGTDGTLDGALVVTLGDELLASSAMTLLPALLAERLTVPVRITGSAAQPHIHADLAACFGNLVTDNRVSAILSEAASDVVSLFTGKEPARPPPAAAPPPAMDPSPQGVRGDAGVEDELIRDLVASGADWDEIEERLEAHRRTFIRQRIG